MKELSTSTKSLIAITIALIILWLVATFDLMPAYYYQTSDHGEVYIETPSKGQTLERIELQFQQYAKNNPNVRLRRTTPIPWWNPWEWHSILTHPRWRYDYMPLSDSTDDNH